MKEMSYHFKNTIFTIVFCCSLPISLVAQEAHNAYLEQEKGVLSFLLHALSGEPVPEVSDYKEVVCAVYPSGDLDVQEICYREKREAWVKAALEDRFGVEIKGKVPRIAVCMSGGGLRAMVGSLGFLKYMQESGLLDVVHYISGLSGSTWALSGWLESQLSIEKYLDFLKKSLRRGLFGNVDKQQMVRELLKKVENGQRISLDDVWGALISQKTLVNPHQKDLTSITLNNYCQMPSDGALPLPIYSCVTPLEDQKDKQSYRWVEWTPFEVRCSYLKSAIPIWGIGRVFDQGVSIDAPSVASLSFGQGVWGSAMSVNVQDLVRFFMDSTLEYEQKIITFLETHFFLDKLTEMRALPAVLPNWNLNNGGFPCQDETSLTLVDAALLCNLPLAPVLDPLREVDIIIVVDLTMGKESVLELPCVEAYAQHYELPFPTLNRSLLKDACSVHHRPGAPTIIYFPLVPNFEYMDGWDPEGAGFTSTLNFTYRPEQVELLSGLTYATCRRHSNVIWDIIKNSL